MKIEVQNLNITIETLTKQLKNTEEAVEDRQVADITTQFELKKEKEKKSPGDFQALQKDLQEQKEQLKKTDDELDEARKTGLEALRDKSTVEALLKHEERKRKEAEEKIKTLEQAQISKPEKPQLQNVKTLQNEILELKKNLDDMKSQFETAEVKLSTGQSWIKRQETIIENQEKETIKLKTNLSTLTKSSHEITQEKQKLKKKSLENEKRIEELLKIEKEKSALTIEVGLLNQTLEDLNSEIDRLNKQILSSVPLDAEQEMNRLKNVNEFLNGELTKIGSKVKTLELDLETMKKDNLQAIEKIEAEKEILKSQQVELLNEILELRTRGAGVPAPKPSEPKIIKPVDQPKIDKLNQEIKDIEEEIRTKVSENKIEPDEDEQKKTTNEIEELRQQIINKSKEKFKIWGLTYPNIPEK